MLNHLCGTQKDHVFGKLELHVVQNAGASSVATARRATAHSLMATAAAGFSPYESRASLTRMHEPDQAHCLLCSTPLRGCTNVGCHAATCVRCGLPQTTTGIARSPTGLTVGADATAHAHAKTPGTIGVLARAWTEAHRVGLAAGLSRVGQRRTLVRSFASVAGVQIRRTPHPEDQPRDVELGLSLGTDLGDPFACRAFVGPGGYDDDWRSWRIHGKPELTRLPPGVPDFEVGLPVPIWLMSALCSREVLSLEAIAYASELMRRGEISPEALGSLADAANPELKPADDLCDPDLPQWRDWEARVLESPTRPVAHLTTGPAGEEAHYCPETHTVTLPAHRPPPLRRGGIVLAPSGVGKSTWIRSLPAGTNWVDGDSLSTFPAGERRTAEGRERQLRRRLGDCLKAASGGSSVLVNFDSPDAVAFLKRSGYLAGSWVPDVPNFASERLKTGRLNSIQISSMGRFDATAALLRAETDVLSSQVECTLPAAGVKTRGRWTSEEARAAGDAGSFRYTDAELCRRLAREGALYSRKALAPAHSATTPGLAPPQSCLCPLTVMVNALLEANVPATALKDELLRRAGEPYDWVTAEICYFFGVLGDEAHATVRHLHQLPFEAFRALAKDMSGLIKRWGVPRSWGMQPAAAAEQHCMGARGLGGIDLEEEKAHRRNRSFAATAPYGDVKRVLVQALDDGMKAAHPAPTLDDKFARAAFWLSSGNQPSGNDTFPEGHITLGGQTSDVKFRHSKKSFLETVSSDHMRSILESTPEIRAVFSIKPNDPAKVRIIYACDDRSNLIASHVLAPIEVAMDHPSLLLRPGAADEMANIHARVRRLAGKVGFMYDFDDFNSQHSTASQQACFDAIAESKWGMDQDGDYLASVRWVSKGLANLRVRFPDGDEIQQPLGLMTGFRGTSFINTMLNYAYFKLAAERAGVSDDAFESLHAGDDVYGTCRDRATAARLLVGLKSLGCRGQESKIAVSHSFGEFLRVRYSPGRVSGYVARTIASLASGNFADKAITDPRDKAATAADHVALCVTRGLSSRVGAPLCRLIARYWGATEVDGRWVHPPDVVLYAPRSRGGFGIGGDGRQTAKWLHVTLPQANVGSSGVRFSRDVPSAATDRAVAWVRKSMPSTLELDYGSLRAALLEASYGGNAVAALRARMDYADLSWLAAWYKRCERLTPRNTTNFGPSADAHDVYTAKVGAACADASELVRGALEGHAPTFPRLYGILSKHAGLQSAARDRYWRTPHGTRCLLHALHAGLTEEFEGLAALIGESEAAAFAWGSADAEYIAQFGVSRLVRDYAWLLYRTRLIAAMRGAAAPPGPALAYALSVARLAGAQLPTVGLVEA